MMIKKVDVKKYRIINIVLFWNGLVMYGCLDEYYDLKMKYWN